MANNNGRQGGGGGGNSNMNEHVEFTVKVRITYRCMKNASYFLLSALTIVSRL